jgi:hypothetical protein
MKEKMKIKTHTFISRIIFPVFVFCILAAGFTWEQAQTLDKSNILNEQYRIRKYLHPSTQPKIAQAVQDFKESFLAAGEESNPVFVGSQVARNQFRTVSPFQVDLLGFYILCQVTADLERDIGLITTEIDKMNLVKEELNRLITSMEEQIEEKTKDAVQESEEEQAQDKETPVLKEHESMEVAPHFKAEYPKSPEIIFSKEPEKMSLSELNNGLYYVKTALNSVHSISETAVKVLRKEMDRRNIFIEELYFQSDNIANITDAQIKNIR